MEEKQSVNFLVGIRCYTYNQSKYITDALNGFTMQQTTFPFVAMVVDDASTDGEQEVIERYIDKYFELSDDKVAYKRENSYAHITFAQHKTNKNCYIVALYLKENLYSKRQGYKKLEYLAEWRAITKYEALCEGDDYWIDPLKLQKQVDFLENNPNHTLCFHAHTVIHKEFSENCHLYNKDVESCIVNELILADADAMATNSMLFRTHLSQVYLLWAKGLPFGDFPLELTLAAKGSVGYINDVMSVYRVETPGSWTSRTHQDLDSKIKHQKDRFQMWKKYNKWTNGTFKFIILRMYIYDLFRYWTLRYMKLFNLKESKLHMVLRWIYRKIK